MLALGVEGRRGFIQHQNLKEGGKVRRDERNRRQNPREKRMEEGREGLR